MSSYLLVRVAPAGGYEAYEVFLRGADLAACFQLDACAVVVAAVIGAVVAAEVLVFLRVVVHLVDPVAVPVVGCDSFQEGCDAGDFVVSVVSVAPGVAIAVCDGCEVAAWKNGLLCETTATIIPVTSALHNLLSWIYYKR